MATKKAPAKKAPEKVKGLKKGQRVGFEPKGRMAGGLKGGKTAVLRAPKAKTPASRFGFKPEGRMAKIGGGMK